MNRPFRLPAVVAMALTLGLWMLSPIADAAIPRQGDPWYGEAATQMSSSILASAPTPRSPEKGQLIKWKYGVATSVPDGMAFGTVTISLGSRVLETHDFQRLLTNSMKNSVLSRAPRTGKYAIVIRGVIAVDGPYGPEEREQFAGRRVFFVETTD